MFFIVPMLDCSFNTTYAAVDSIPRIAVNHPYVYATQTTTDNFKVIDISNPNTPVEVASVSTGTGTGPDWPFYHNGYVYMAYNTTQEFVSWDVSNPASPTQADSILYGRTMGRGSANGNIACLPLAAGYSTQNAAKINISDPTNMAHVTYWNYSGDARQSICFGSEFHGGYFFVYGVLNVNTIFIAPIDPTSWATVGPAWSAAGGAPFGDVTYNEAGTLAFMTHPSAAQYGILDLSDLNAPSYLGSFTPGGGYGAGGTNNAITYRESTERLYIGRYNGLGTLGVYVFDVSNPSSPSNVGMISVDGAGTSDLRIVGDECESLAIATWSTARLKFIGNPLT